MTPHLTDDELRDWLMDAPSVRLGQHMAACSQCRDEALRLRGAVAGFRNALQAAAPRSAWQPMLPVSSARPWWRQAASPLAWAPAIAAVVLLAFAIRLFQPAPRTVHAPTPRPAAQVVYDDAKDEALLAEVQDALEQRSPMALAPAEELGPDLDAMRSAPSQTSKGTQKGE